MKIDWEEGNRTYRSCCNAGPCSLHGCLGTEDITLSVWAPQEDQD